jgi:hypothetical protein
MTSLPEAEAPPAWIHQRIDGAALLDDVHGFYCRFVAFPSPHAAVACTLWAAHTHAMDAWESTPRLAFLSPEPGSGKSRALEITELLVPRPAMAVNMSPAALFRIIGGEEGLPTILFDEIDTVFGPKAKDNEDLRGLLNAGWRRGAKTYRVAMHGKKAELESFEAFSAAALAGLGNLPDTILTRSIIVRMRRRAPGERVEPYRRREHSPAGEHLCDRLAEWISSNLDKLAQARPTMPPGIEDRPADVWEPLLAIADAAGGEWPMMAREAAVALVADAADTPASLGVRLLADIRSAFGDREQMATADLLDCLNGMDESPWGDLRGKPIDSRRLARMLSPYGAKPCNIRTATGTPKGYRSEALWDAWQRYLAPLPSESATSATSATSEGPMLASLSTAGREFVADVALVADLRGRAGTACVRCAGEGCEWCEAAA